MFFDDYFLSYTKKARQQSIAARDSFLACLPLLPAAMYFQWKSSKRGEKNSSNNNVKLFSPSPYYEPIALVSLSALVSYVTYWSVSRYKRQKYLQNSTCASLEHQQEQLDDLYLQRAHQLRLALDPPRQSNFRVVACLLLDNGTTIFGTNDEPSPCLSGAICAERAAFLEYRRMYPSYMSSSPSPMVKAIYLVTDAQRPVPPGTACREYLHGHISVTDETRVVMQSSDPTSPTWTLTMAELFPFPSIYAGMTASEQCEYGMSLEEDMELQIGDFSTGNNNSGTSSGIPGMFPDQILRLVEAAHQASLRDDLDVLHPIRYGAAMALIRPHQPGGGGGTIEFIQASQVKALEYSCSQDAICQMAPAILQATRHNNNNSNGSYSHGAVRILALVQVDQFGIPHAPFAPARSFLVEHGLGEVPVILTARKPDAVTCNLLQQVECTDLVLVDREENDLEGKCTTDLVVARNDGHDSLQDDLEDAHSDDITVPYENKVPKSSNLVVIAVPAQELAPFIPHFQ